VQPNAVRAGWDWRRLGLLFARPSFSRNVAAHPTGEELSSFCVVLSTRRCVKGLAALPRMLTPVAGFRRLLEPSPQSIPTSDVPWVTLGHRRVRSSGPISCLSTQPCGACRGFTPESRTSVFSDLFRAEGREAQDV
jgi:hypothetical protein